MQSAKERANKSGVAARLARVPATTLSSSARRRSNKPVPRSVANTILSTLTPQAPRPCPRPAFRERSHAACTPHVPQLQTTRAAAFRCQQGSDGLDMHTVTVRGATCNEHRARSPPRTAGTPADMTCKAEHKHLLLLGKVWQTSCSSGCKAAPPGPAGSADLLQGGRPGWQAAHLRADRRSGAFGTGCKLQPCLQRAAARRAGALLPSAACTLRTWEASPECMLIASRSVGERPTPQASRRRQERGARTSPRTASCRRLYDLPRVRAIFIFETTSFRVRNYIFSVTGQSASGRLQRGWGGLGGGWRREHYWYSNPQHTSMTV